MPAQASEVCPIQRSVLVRMRVPAHGASLRGIKPSRSGVSAAPGVLFQLILFKNANGDELIQDVMKRIAQGLSVQNTHFGAESSHQPPAGVSGNTPRTMPS